MSLVFRVMGAMKRLEKSGAMFQGAFGAAVASSLLFTEEEFWLIQTHVFLMSNQCLAFRQPFLKCA